MVSNGLLEKSTSYEQRQNVTQSGYGAGVWRNVSRYGLPDQCAVVHDSDGKKGAIDGVCVRLSEQVAATEKGDL